MFTFILENDKRMILKSIGFYCVKHFWLIVVSKRAFCNGPSSYRFSAVILRAVVGVFILKKHFILHNEEKSTSLSSITISCIDYEILKRIKRMDPGHVLVHSFTQFDQDSTNWE